MDKKEYASSRSVYEQTALSLSKMIQKQGEAYHCPWHGLSVAPYNPFTRRSYSGLNHLILWRAQLERGFQTSFWASERAWKRMGGTFQGGDLGVSIVIPVTEGDDASPSPFTEKVKGSHRLKGKGKLLGFTQGVVYPYEAMGRLSYTSFMHEIVQNDQRDLLDQVLSDFVQREHITVRHDTKVVCYYPGKDVIVLPEKPDGSSSLEERDRYRVYAIHEMIHATAAPSRCNRLVKAGHGGLSFAEEELVAEIGTAFLCSRMGLSSFARPDHQDYVKGWISALGGSKNDRVLTLVFGKARQAVDYIMQEGDYASEEVF